MEHTEKNKKRGLRFDEKAKFRAKNPLHPWRTFMNESKCSNVNQWTRIITHGMKNGHCSCHFSVPKDTYCHTCERRNYVKSGGLNLDDSVELLIDEEDSTQDYDYWMELYEQQFESLDLLNSYEHFESFA